MTYVTAARTTPLAMYISRRCLAHPIKPQERKDGFTVHHKQEIKNTM